MTALQITGQAGGLALQHASHGVDIAPAAPDRPYEHRTVASYERELERYRRAEIQLRQIIALDESLLRQKDKIIQNQALLSSESDHRLLNDLQMIVSLLSLQSRATANAEAASQLAAAADRIAMIGRIHRRLHSFDGATTVAFKKFLKDLCSDFSSLVSSGQQGERDIAVEGVEIELPTETCRALGFIANELITNAAKYGKGRITVRLEQNLKKGMPCRFPTTARLYRKNLIQQQAKDSE
jgi:two-component sensor histidine kinase